MKTLLILAVFHCWFGHMSQPADPIVLNLFVHQPIGAETPTIDACSPNHRTPIMPITALGSTSGYQAHAASLSTDHIAGPTAGHRSYIPSKWLSPSAHFT